MTKRRARKFNRLGRFEQLEDRVPTAYLGYGSSEVVPAAAVNSLVRFEPGDYALFAVSNDPNSLPFANSPRSNVVLGGDLYERLRMMPTEMVSNPLTVAVVSASFLNLVLEPPHTGAVVDVEPSMAIYGSPSWATDFTPIEVEASPAPPSVTEIEAPATHVEPLAAIRFSITDESGQSIATIPVGQTFRLTAFAKDLRSNAQGVFAAYADIDFDPQLASPKSDAEILAGYQAKVLGTISPGRIDDVGAIISITQYGDEEREVFSMTFTAAAPGELSFRSNSTESIFTPVLLFNVGTVLSPQQVEFGSASVTVTAA